MALGFSLFDIRRILENHLQKEIDVCADLPINKISTDTRALAAGDLFVALRGENFDGHTFAETALGQGASGLVVEQFLSLSRPLPQFMVKDTLGAYQAIAQAWRQRFSIPVIGITGSVGKTTTKELTAAVLSLKGNVRKTAVNNNNEIGVPKTLLEVTPEDDYAIIEMAMRGRGEIALLAEIAQPTIGLITNVGTAHIGRLGSEQAIAEAKCELLATMPSTSLAILNWDNLRLRTTAQQVWSGSVLSYGLEGGDIQGTLLDAHTLQVQGHCLPLPLPGRHNASNYLAALAVAQALGIDWQPLTQGLPVELPSGRARRYTLDPDILLLDETYNAGLESMLAALQLLRETPGQRHIAVLGAMKELGDRAPEFHDRVGQRVASLGINHLFLLANDPMTDAIASGAAPVPCHVFTDHESLIQALQAFMQPGDRLLFKASNSVGLGQVVGKLKAFEVAQ
ncbi:UDP-N-acetylmuramoyl-tripeptide--D-alanyl-D-alanine ligase [Synechocystis sp. LKSZ1]|uniref:UDP-N-acetylmuramoyl-tripeptide--D-alanyl-D- alanine ligase n=1 Tax=Synechocystis sp. LKSZ1 TaxID=3144951 RepID=UPI00336BD6A5